MAKHIRETAKAAWQIVSRYLVPFLRTIFGELKWSPPSWSLTVAAAVKATAIQATNAIATARAKHPRRFWISIASVAFVVVAGGLGWRWYRNRPQPNYLKFTATWPSPTPLYPPGAAVCPLRISFSGSAARLGAVGKPVPEGIAIDPAIKGAWKWETDYTLTFTPAGDWEIGRDYTVTFSRELFPSQVILKSYSFQFRSPAFVASIEEVQFYEDPVDPRSKKIVATVSFTHLVDKAAFEKRIALRMRVEPVHTFKSKDTQPFGFKVIYDADNPGIAYIHSDPFSIPARAAAMLVIIAPGVHAARGGPGTAEPLRREVSIPGIDTYFRIEGVNTTAVANERDEMERIATISSTVPVRSEAMAGSVSVVMLPEDRPPMGDRPLERNFQWSDPTECGPEVTALATPVSLKWMPSEHEFDREQSFKFAAQSGRFLLVTVHHGLTGFGDYQLAKDFSAVVAVADLPKLLKIAEPGAVLSLSGEKKISIVSRGVAGMKIEVSRLLPGSVSHLVSQTQGNFSHPVFWNANFGLDDLSEVFSEVRPLEVDETGQNQYSVFDFAPLLSRGALPHGLFYLKIQAWNPKQNQPEAQAVTAGSYVTPVPRTARLGRRRPWLYRRRYQPQESYGGEEPSDERMILLTDLGFLVKDSADGSHDVFVESIRTGLPTAGAKVSVLGRNGLPILSQETDAEGRVTFPDLKDFAHEKAPTAYVVEKEGDFSFLPYDRADRQLDFSRFDTGGIYTSEVKESLQAYLFSDRGIYRPADSIHIGMVVKRFDWQPLPEGLPLQLIVTDPRGQEIHRERLKFTPAGFEEYTTATQENSPTGNYDFSLYIVRDDNSTALLGSTSVRVEDFQPDRMTIKASLSAPPSDGWISPEGLTGQALLRNLFGTAAAGRKVKGTLQLEPSAVGFAKYVNYLFVDTYATHKSYEEDLGETTTGADGRAKFDFQMGRFDPGVYRLRFVAEGFEPEGGRSVLADATATVSPTAYLIGYKADGDLAFVDKGSRRAINLIAIDPKLNQVALGKLTAELLQFQYISVLTKQPNGTFAYQSVRKETSRQKKPLVIPAAGLAIDLPTAEAGSFALVIRGAKGEELNRIAFEVAGHANVSRNLEREAELRIKLDKREYAPGGEAEIEIVAPYTGAGLITVERDRVYAAKWFRTATTESVQKIRIPPELEGNGYIVVTFVRSLDSPEVFTSPLSYGAAPFAVGRARHTQAIKLGAPAMMIPGNPLAIDYQTDGPAKIVVVAVDEGILQVAGYITPDPLSFFFRKRALEVGTRQILDLILPELHLLNEAAAPGGGEGKLARHLLNPFKRKGQRPVAFWSGIIDSDGKPASIKMDVPGYFNGTIRVFAIAVSDDAVGAAEKKVVAQNYFVIQPQAPYFASPGDEFEVTALVANNLKPPAPGISKVKLELAASNALEVLSARSQEAEIKPGSDQVMHFRLRAKPSLGNATMTFTASGAGKHTSYALSLSVRPASPYVTTISSGYVKKSLLKSVKADLPVTRKLYPEYRQVRASASSIPMGLADGLILYLKEFPYGCTEQVVSQAFPAVVLGARPELGISVEDAANSLSHAIATLEGRQNANGEFGLWSAGPDVNTFVSVYATHFLIEMREHGLEVPPGLIERAIGSLRAIVATPGTTLPELRTQSYAVYLLARDGIVPTNQLNTIRETLDRDFAGQWHDDMAALLLAATYQMLKMDRQADELLYYLPAAKPITPDYADYYDDLVYRSAYIFLMSKHFPDRAKRIGGDQILALADSIVAGRINTFSSSYAILALDAYASAAGIPAQAKLAFSEILADGGARPLDFAGKLFAHADVPPDAKSVHIEGDTPFVLFYQLAEAGYDLQPPTSEIRNRIEVFREYRDEKGKVINSSPLDSKVEVYVSVRALEEPVPNVAIVDMIPGGFEADISPQGLGSRNSLVQDESTWHPDYIDVREDRLIYYGEIGRDARTFVYRLKPTNRGKFAVSPLYAEGMYDRSVQARSLGAEFTIADPPPAPEAAKH